MWRPSERNRAFLTRIKDGIQDLESCIPDSGYAEPTLSKDVLESLSPLREEVSDRMASLLWKVGLCPTELKTASERFLELHRMLPSKIHKHNIELAESSVRDVSNIVCPVDGRMLDTFQLKAIAMEVRNRLVLAGAGTGKTSTVVGLAKYLVKTGRASPEEILFLSYTNSAVDELSTRIRHELGTRCDVSTFHRLGLRIIAGSEGVTPRITGIVLKDFVDAHLESFMKEPGYRRRVLEYMASENRYSGDETDFRNSKEYRRYITENPLITLNGENVKSHGEAEIADFLFMNSVGYAYEEPYLEDTRDSEHVQYRPDFHISGTDIYIEYFGIDRDGNAAPFMTDRDGTDGSDSYRESMEWKRNLHKNRGTRLISLYAYRRTEGSLLDDLKQALEKNGVRMSPADPEELAAKTIPNSMNDLGRLSSQMVTAITLLKGTGLPWDSAYPRGDGARERTSLKKFGSVLKPVYDAYLDALIRGGEIDFEDMLNLAADHVRKGDWGHGYRYVVVDEYQDISRSRMNLLTAMRGTHDFSLFCVGDDWQSIYRFNGSDVGYILDFERFWGPAETIALNNTYRYSGKLLDLGCSFMAGSKHQTRKKMFGKGPETDVGVLKGRNNMECTREIAKVLDGFPKGESVLFLGRYRHDIASLDSRVMTWDADISTGYFRIVYPPRRDLKISFMTIHGSKGLEADHVFILNNRKGPGGFPQTSREPPAIRLLLNNGGDNWDEERRLMYVAMTRARKSLHFVTIEGEESRFMREMFPTGPKDLVCPRCGGRLIVRKGPYGRFYGCSNYSKGCRYVRKIN